MRATQNIVVKSLMVAIILSANTWLSSCSATPPLPLPVNIREADTIDHLMESAIQSGLIAGSVVLIGDRGGVLLERAYGKMSCAPDARQMDVDAVFDIASLTKVVATTTSVMKLAEEGKISLVDPVKKWFPEFRKQRKDDLLIMNLLTHTSGLHDFPMPVSNPLQGAVEVAASQQMQFEPGKHFRYADINFILLGELVKRVTGETLDRYAAENLFNPLEMVDTGFNPPAERVPRCAATLNEDKSPLVGLAQDYNARLLGGVAGHAGVFSTAFDLSRFCRMILNDGELDGRRILSERAVAQMTAPYFSGGGKVVRGLGWDRESPYSAPRGNGFSEVSFGHTGYSGTSIWIDPENDIFVLLLTARLNFKNVSEFNQLRSDLSSFVAARYIPAVKTAKIARRYN